MVKDPVNEVAIFGIGIGILLGALGVYVLASLRVAQPLWGLQRHLALGLPLVMLGVLHLGAGIGLLRTRSPLAVVAVMISGAFLGILYFLFEISTIGFLKGRLISAGAYLIPIGLVIRGMAAIHHLKEGPSKRTPGLPPLPPRRR